MKMWWFCTLGSENRMADLLCSCNRNSLTGRDEGETEREREAEESEVRRMFGNENGSPQI